MTMHPVPARLIRGARRTGAFVWRKVRDPLGRRRHVTEGQEVTAQETRTMLGLMADANAAGASMTDEQRLMLIQAAPGMRAREAVLLGIPNRSTVEENELHMIRREMAALEGRPVVQPQRFLPAIPAVAGFAVRPWMLWGGALAAVALWGGYNDVRAGRAENQRDEAEANLARAERTLAATTTERDLLADAVASADAQTQRTAETIEAERARRLAAEREARRIRNEMERARAGAGSVDYGFGSVRDTGAGSPGAGGGDAAGRDPG